MLRYIILPGTGNSLYMARDIAEVLKGDLIPIASTINKEAIDSDADSIGIVISGLLRGCTRYY